MKPLGSLISVAALVLIGAASASAQERLCDASAENCRIPLINVIDNERVGIDVGVWFFKDDRFVQALIRAQNRGVRIRMLMDTRANTSYAENAAEFDKLIAAGIPMRRRIAGDILHWKLMIFDGQGTVEWSGANYSPDAFVPLDPYTDYEDEVIYFSRQLVGSFMTIFDNIWTNTRDYENYRNVNGPLVRVHPTYPIDARLNCPPTNSYQDRLVPLIDKEPKGGLIDVDMYRITMPRPVDALIRAAARGVRQRLYLEPNEYNNPNRPGNKTQMDRLVAAAKQYPETIEIRMRRHRGLNHQKTVWLHAQHIVVFGTSNWSDASDDNQLEANIFTDRDPGDGLNNFLFSELQRIFVRKFYNRAPDGSIETVAWRTPMLPEPPPDGGSSTCTDPAATSYGGPAPCTYPPPPPPPPPPPSSDAPDIVLWAGHGTATGNWEALADGSAAGGSAMWNPDAAQTKIAPALASPGNSFQMTFTARANTPYHLWVRLRAQNDAMSNDSVHLQFSDSVTASNTATMRIASTSSAEVVLQRGTGDSSIHGWGWSDNGWGTAGANIFFAATGTHTVRIQQREDGAIVDQIVLSANTYLNTAPGAPDDDSTILPESSGQAPPPPPPPPSGGSDVVLHPGDATVIVGNWVRNPDATAATGASLLNTNLGAAKVATASASPTDYFEMTFNAEAGKGYRLWIRGKATGDNWANDSVYIQFSDSVDASSIAKYRIGSTDATAFNLEECSGCGESGWGWEDNGWGQNVFGPLIYFATTGTHTIRIQPREDGLAIDQILLSPSTYMTASPGATKNDAAILQ